MHNCTPLRITGNALEHIFKDNKTGGFHSVPGGVNPVRTKVLGNPTNIVTSGKWKGAYEATVRICPKGRKCFKKKNNSFFPNSWTQSRVQTEINAAYIDAISKGKIGSKLLGMSATGGSIQIIVKPSGELVTVFPLLR